MISWDAEIYFSCKMFLIFAQYYVEYLHIPINLYSYTVYSYISNFPQNVFVQSTFNDSGRKVSVIWKKTIRTFYLSMLYIISIWT